MGKKSLVCANCKWYYGASEGQCRKQAPIATVRVPSSKLGCDLEDRRHFAGVRALDWCGDFTTQH